MSTIPKNAITVTGDDITVDAELLAPQLGLSVLAMKAAMRAGEIRTLVERGTDEDAGRMRLTFRYGASQYSLIREPDGQLRETQPPPPERRPIRPSIMQLVDSQASKH